MHRKAWRTFAATVLGIAGASATWAQGPTLGGCPVFPADNVWNTRIDKLPVDPLSAQFVATIGGDKSLHPDFGSGMINGVPWGIPFNIIPGDQKRVKIAFDYRGDSDLSNYPIPPNAVIEADGRKGTDAHILLVDKDNCVLWEIFAASKLPDGTWKAGSGATFDLKCNCIRADGMTSADAAGLPILPGLARYEEVAAGEIRHALRFTTPQTRNAAVWPARHFASRLADQKYPPMGERFRLKSSVDISHFSRDAQVILRALKTYGMVLADNGGPWFISGAPGPQWNNNAIEELKRIKGSDFEAVEDWELFVTHNSTRARRQ